MSLADAARNCLRGRAIPPSLETLWKRQEAGDEALRNLFMIDGLLSDLAPLESGYGAPMAARSPDRAANVRAHRLVFEELAFFAELEDSEFLAYYLGDPSPEPPVVKLDNEGQYSWEGRNVAEALFRISDGRAQPDDARSWLQAAGLDLGALDGVGASTQFLPNLSEKQARAYNSEVGKPREALVAAPAPADPRDPLTWILRPGAEVREAIEQRLGAPLSRERVWCNADGLVRSVALDASFRPEPVLGIALGAARADVERTLGAPTSGRGNWLLFERGDRRFRFEFDPKGAVSKITVSAPKAE